MSNVGLDRRAKGRLAVNASWLLRLRWVAVAGQLITVAVVELLLGVRLPWMALLSIIGGTAVTNVGLTIWWRRAAQRWQPAASDRTLLAGTMIFDLLALTALLYFTGGPTNPFAVFYVVNLTLSAVILPDRWAWALTAIAAACLAGLYVDHVPLPEPDDIGRKGEAFAWGLYQNGSLVALLACAAVITYFVTRVTGELQQREAELRAVQQQRATSQRLEALATLAAGAGHELASPLSTIAVIANELTHHLDGADVPSTVLDDVALIRSELDHCRSILDRMSGQAGQAAGEEVTPVPMQRVLQEVVDGLRRRERVDISFRDGSGRQKVVAPLQGLAQAIRGVVQNALDATSPDGRVELTVSRADQALIVNVRDQGPGMTPEVLARAGEPFFTTKQPGKGMGLGLFLTRNVIERLGGKMELRSHAGQGTAVEIRLPTSGRRSP